MSLGLSHIGRSKRPVLLNQIFSVRAAAELPAGRPPPQGGTPENYIAGLLRKLRTEAFRQGSKRIFVTSRIYLERNDLSCQIARRRENSFFVHPRTCAFVHLCLI